MKSGKLTLNGIDDKELVKILEVKMRHEGTLQFPANEMQPGQIQRQGGGPTPGYNNVNLSFNNEQGLEAVKEILHHLTEKK
jgi:hypothetical protein